MIFVSHRESDTDLAKALVGYLRSSLDVPDSKIRCTSVPGYQLPFGNNIAGQLKADINASHAIFVLLTPASVKSSWVLFELGASWALGKVIIPILGPGISLNDVPGPVKEYPVVRVDDANAASRLRDAITQVASELQLGERGGGRAQSELESFMKVLRGWTAAVPPRPLPARAFQLSWLLVILFMKQARHPGAIEAEIEYHAAHLGLTLPPSWHEHLCGDASGKGLQELVEHLGGQMAARHPRLLPYFEAAYNILLGAGRQGPEGVKDAISRLSLPKELSELRANALSWANEIHSYFEDALREGET